MTNSPNRWQRIWAKREKLREWFAKACHLRDSAKSELAGRPREHRCCRLIIDILIIFLVALALLYSLHKQSTINDFVSGLPLLEQLIGSLPYPALAYILILATIPLFILHAQKTIKPRTHESRLMDPSEVSQILSDAEYYLAKTKSKSKRREYTQKPKEKQSQVISYTKDVEKYERWQLHKEVERLKNLGPHGWTEYEVAILEKKLVEFLDVFDLMETANSYISELNDYQQDVRYRYEWNKLAEEGVEVRNLIEEIEGIVLKEKTEGDSVETELSTNSGCLEENVKKLKAKIYSLIDHTTWYSFFWSKGSTLIHSLVVYGALIASALLVLGIYPLLFCFCGNPEIKIYHWAFLGTSGAIAASFQKIRQQYAVDIGESEGKQEIKLAIFGAILGPVAGVLIYGMISGGLLNGELFPLIPPDLGKESYYVTAGKSIFWAFAAGYSFEKVFDNVRSTSNSLNP